jgi:beta-lactamase superfamily II metal-dependent hydrolase
MAATPKQLTIRTYQVGFGDCFLLSFEYAKGKERHILVDFGSTALPEKTPKKQLTLIANDIKQRTGGKLNAVVATHRHRDHFSGFQTNAKKNGTGNIIAGLKPDYVIQPWTEDPKLGPNAKAPKSPSNPKRRAVRHTQSLREMQALSGIVVDQLKQIKYMPRELRAAKTELGFLGEDNIANPSAVRNLMHMAAKKQEYLYFGMKTALSKVLPGIKVHVLGPPTVEQSAAIQKQRSRDPDNFWNFQARALSLADNNRRGGANRALLFPRHVQSHGPVFPISCRWLIYHARKLHVDQLLQIVRMLDKAMNNTSLILAFETKKQLILFPGDAQIENWEYALSHPNIRNLLKKVTVYKVGHHGSKNATPIPLWEGFKNRKPPGKGQMLALMSTMDDQHGSEADRTEVPRSRLVNALRRETKLIDTRGFKKNLFQDEVVNLP